MASTQGAIESAAGMLHGALIALRSSSAVGDVYLISQAGMGVAGAAIATAGAQVREPESLALGYAVDWLLPRLPPCKSAVACVLPRSAAS